MADDPLLRDLMEHELASACDVVRAGGEYLPRFIAMNDARELFYIVTPWGGEDEKVATLQFLKLFFQRHRVQRYVQIAEAWLVERDKEYVSGAEPPPSECADRIEAIFVSGVSHDSVQFASVRTRRDRDVISFSEPDWSGDKFSGRMTTLLPCPDDPNLSLQLQGELDRIFKQGGGERKPWTPGGPSNAR